MKPHYDVIIAGAGPAGCAAAISCKTHGLKTLLIASKKNNENIEGEVQPSESVHPGLISILTQLNAAHCITQSSKAIYEGIEVNGVPVPLGEDEHGPWQGHHINRQLFDAAMLQTAAAQGVRIHDDDVVVDFIFNDDSITGVKTKSGKQFTCSYVIDATGHKRFAGKKLGFKESYHSPPLVAWTGISADLPENSTYYKNNFTKFTPHATGWTWLAPQPPMLCTWTRLELKGKQQFLPPLVLQSFPLVAKVKTSNRRWRLFRPVCKEGILLCGDAAAIIDPAAGQGILNAVVSAVMAAKTVKACIHNQNFEAIHLAKYDEWLTSDYLEKVTQLKAFYHLHGIKIFAG